MHRASMLVLAGLLAGSGTALAQTSTNANASASASTNARAQTSGVKTSGQASTSADAKASTQNAQATAGLAEGAKVHGRLVGSLDAKKNKPGDRVEARTMEDVKQNGKVVLPKGTRLIGHVTRAQARAKGQSKSVLGVTFDRAELRNGEQMPLHLAIQALATTQAGMQASTDSPELAGVGGGFSPPMGGGAAGGGLIGGTLGATSNVAGGVAAGVGNTAGATLGSTTATTAHSAGAVGGLDVGGMLTSNSRGVFGMRGVSLASSASNATQASTLVSSSRNVHLSGGTQMLLRVEGSKK